MSRGSSKDGTKAEGKESSDEWDPDAEDLSVISGVGAAKEATGGRPDASAVDAPSGGDGDVWGRKVHAEVAAQGGAAREGGKSGEQRRGEPWGGSGRGRGDGVKRKRGGGSGGAGMKQDEQIAGGAGTAQDEPSVSR